MITILKKMHSVDKSIKYIFETKDNNYFESVYIPKNKRKATLCVSSQIGCGNKCTHCATGKIDYIRDLDFNEIVEQVFLMIEDNEIRDIIKYRILFMGMGEPFFNSDNVMKAIELLKKDMILSDDDFTISTVGIPQKIRDFADLKTNIRLAISFHAVNDELRNKIIPLNKILGLQELVKSAKYYNKMTEKAFLFQYTVIKDINDSLENAVELSNFLMKNELNCEVKIIPFNTTKSSRYLEPDLERINSFYDLISKVVPTKVSESHGRDIEGGCGQMCIQNL